VFKYLGEAGFIDRAESDGSLEKDGRVAEDETLASSAFSFQTTGANVI
jgi:hypothetical protein